LLEEREGRSGEYVEVSGELMVDGEVDIENEIRVRESRCGWSDAVGVTRRGGGGGGCCKRGARWEVVVGGTWREQAGREEGIVFRAKKSRANNERLTAWMTRASRFLPIIISYLERGRDTRRGVSGSGQRDI
jgi:hypothetical protein